VGHYGMSVAYSCDKTKRRNGSRRRNGAKRRIANKKTWPAVSSDSVLRGPRKTAAVYEEEKKGDAFARQTE